MTRERLIVVTTFLAGMLMALLSFIAAVLWGGQL